MFVDHIEVKKKSIIDEIKPDYVISFNYTHTYNRIYNIDENNICFIHGECCQNKNNNMVLGIDEYRSR